MRKTFLMEVAVAALGGAASAADLKFAPGEDLKVQLEELRRVQGRARRSQGRADDDLRPWRGEDEAFFRSILAYFTEATGADAKYSSSENYEQQIVIDTQAGSPPNIAVLPQPGLLADLASKGFLTPLGDEKSQWVKDNYGAGDSWVGYGTYKGKDGKEAFYAFPYKADVKSLVWYVPENFKEAGYKVPTTMEELQALTEQIVKDGGVPWCIGLGSGGATGWPATDWIEDIMLRQQKPDAYGKWTTNEVKFTDPAVAAAIEEFGSFAKNEKYVIAWRCRRGSNGLPRQPEGSLRRAAEVLSPPSGVVHPIVLPGGHKTRSGCRLLLYADIRGACRPRQQYD